MLFFSITICYQITDNINIAISDSRRRCKYSICTYRQAWCIAVKPTKHTSLCQILQYTRFRVKVRTSIIYFLQVYCHCHSVMIATSPICWIYSTHKWMISFNYCLRGKYINHYTLEFPFLNLNLLMYRIIISFFTLIMMTCTSWGNKIDVRWWLNSRNIWIWKQHSLVRCTSWRY